MTAEQMFLKQKYIKSNTTNGSLYDSYIEYAKDEDDYIRFYLKTKKIKVAREKVPFNSFNLKVLACINKQVEELGWCKDEESQNTI